jgi:hypothetical protein
MGQLLPGSLRRLMYEPMCDDLWRAHLFEPVRSGRLGLRIRFFGSFLATVGYALPRYFVERSRLTPFGTVAFVLLTGVALVSIALLAPWIVELAASR